MNEKERDTLKGIALVLIIVGVVFLLIGGVKALFQ